MNTKVMDGSPNRPAGPPRWDGWLTLGVSFLFVLLYSAALLGWLRPLSDVTMLARLEPLIFLMLGYHFGRVPGRKNEAILRFEMQKIEKRRDSLQGEKELARSERDLIGEKIRNTRIALRSGLKDLHAGRTGQGGRSSTPDPENAGTRAIEMAINILDS